MQQHAGVFRTQVSMDEGVAKVAALRERVKAIGLKDKSQVFNTARIEALEVENLIEAAQATMVSAAARKESRGAHTVNDYGDTPQHPNGRNDEVWMKHTLWHSSQQQPELQGGEPQAAHRRIHPAQSPHLLIAFASHLP